MTSVHSGNGSSGSSSSKVSLTISIGGCLRKSPHSAFRSFQRTQSNRSILSSATASAVSSSVSTPQTKNVLHPTGTVLNELQKLQLDITDSAPSSTQSSASIESSNTQPPTDTISPNHGSANSTRMSPLKENDSTSVDDPISDDDQPDRSRKPLHRCTVDLLDLFRTCNPKYSWSGVMQPRRVLTSPAVPHHTHPYDNVNSNLIMSVGDILWHNTEDSHVFREKLRQNANLKSDEKRRYVKSFKVMELLGEGTFGQVVKCEEVISLAGERLNLPPAAGTHTPAKSKVYRAIKVIKNKPAYYNQALMEIQILKQLNEKFDPEHKHHLLRMIESFNCHGHLCLLSVNLYDLMKQNGYRGLSWSLLRLFLKQILDALTVLHEAHIIHCDLKPENILLNSFTAPDLTLIDFGSACFEAQTVYSYIQSRFYRAGEVLIGLPYNNSIDHWSFGCLAAELYLGLPLFPGITQQNQLYRIIKFIGPPPPAMLAKGKNTRKFFKIEPSHSPNEYPKYILKTAEEFAADTHTEVAVHKTYFKGNTLKEVVDLYPMRKGMTDAQKAQELEDRKCFLHFLQGFLRWDPKERWLPKQALHHPFITRQPLSTFNEEAFEKLRHAPVTQPTTNASSAAASSSSSSSSGGAPSSSASASSSVSSSAGVAVSSVSSASVPASGTANVPASAQTNASSNTTTGATVGAALLTNQELALRQIQLQQQQQQHLQQQLLQQQQQQQQQHQQQQHQQQARSSQSSSFYSAPISASMPQQSYVPMNQQQQRPPQSHPPNGASVPHSTQPSTFGAMPMTHQSSNLLANAIMQQQQQQQQQQQLLQQQQFQQQHAHQQLLQQQQQQQSSQHVYGTSPRQSLQQHSNSNVHPVNPNQSQTQSYYQQQYSPTSQTPTQPSSHSYPHQLTSPYSTSQPLQIRSSNSSSRQQSSRATGSSNYYNGSAQSSSNPPSHYSSNSSSYSSPPNSFGQTIGAMLPNSFNNYPSTQPMMQGFGIMHQQQQQQQSFPMGLPPSLAPMGSTPPTFMPIDGRQYGHPNALMMANSHHGPTLP